MKLNLFNKSYNALVLMFISVLTFAQEARDARGFRPNEPEPLEAGPGSAPIDDYQFLLIGVAVLLIAYFIYKRRQALQA